MYRCMGAFFDMNVHADIIMQTKWNIYLSQNLHTISFYNMRTIKKELKTQHIRGKSENILCQLKMKFMMYF